MTFRKRKNPAPFFRMTKPHDPVTGDWGPLMLNALLCRFKLTEALDTTMDRATALIREQWGYGARHSYVDEIKVMNYTVREEDTEADPPVEAVYRFSGSIDEMGIAYWDQSQRWVIIHLGNPGLVGGCLAENHPGRGTAFDICLGTWNSADASGGRWVFNCDAPKVKAIDWRFGVPYPDAGAQGLFEVRASTTYGIIYECVSLDCTSPGTCED